MGCSAGIITGLIPGVHINLVSIVLLNVSGYLLGFANPLSLGIFIISMAVTHSFLDSIPSVFLGAPDADQALNVLPGHRMLMEGKGFEAVKLTVIGSLLCLILTLMFIPLIIPFLPKVYEGIKPYIGWILLCVAIFMVLKASGIKKKLWSFFVFVFSGALGIIVLNFPNLQQPLFPLLSGMFGVSTLLLSLTQKVNLPKQVITETIKISKLRTIKALFAAVFSGSLTGIFPGLGAAQAAIIAIQLVGDIGMYAFMILIGGINTVNFIFSLATLYAIHKARNGAVIVVMEIVKSIDTYGLMLFLFCALVAGSIATFLALKISKGFARTITKLNYNYMCYSVIGLIYFMVAFFSGFWGIVILSISTAIGIIPAVIGVGRNNAMGCLLLPVIIYFLA